MTEALEARLRALGGRVSSRASSLAFRWATPARRFVIVTTGRTGSELLVSLLNSHPAITCDGEILANRRASPGGSVLWRSARARQRGAAAYGFKLLAHQAEIQNGADPAAFLRSFPARGFRLIVLERRDWLQQAISSARAARTQYHYRRSDAPVFSPTRLDPVAVIAALFLIEDAVAFTRSTLAGIPQLNLVYEDDLADPQVQQATADRIFDYLDLDSSRVSTDLVKYSPTSIAGQVENFDELAAAISATRYANLLSADHSVTR